jgi:hypothetical protein
MKRLSSLRKSLNRLMEAFIEKTPNSILAFLVISLTVFIIATATQGIMAYLVGYTIPAAPLDTGLESGTVTQPSDDLSDPQQDVLGWERGYWSSESISVNVSDGLTEQERHAMLGRTMARVETIRKEEFEQMWVYNNGAILNIYGWYQKQPTSIELIPRRAIENNDEGGTMSSKPFQDTQYESVFLVGENTSEPKAIAQMTANSQLAAYSYRTNSINMVTGPSSQVTEAVLAHELVHALQDQHNLLGGPKGTVEEKQVTRTRIEGTANAPKQLYEERCGNEWECWGEDQSQSDEHRYEARYGLRHFPYSEGSDFVMDQYRDGGWAAVNQLHQNHPVSSEQIIYDTYPRDPPMKISLNDTNADGWKQKRPGGSSILSWLPGNQQRGYGTLGAAAIGMMFYGTTVDEYNNSSVVSTSKAEHYDYSYRYVRGWEGDRLHVYQNDTGETGYVWKLRWESPAEAREFVSGYRRVLSHWGGERVADDRWVIRGGPYADAFSIERNKSTVMIVNAPTLKTLDDIYSSA